jgi:hypothetical protein
LRIRKIMDPSLDVIDSTFSCVVGITRASTIRVLHVDTQKYQNIVNNSFNSFSILISLMII